MTQIRFAPRALTAACLLAGVLALSACTSEQVIDNTVGLTAGATKAVAKGAVGAGKAVYRGVSGSESD